MRIYLIRHCHSKAQEDPVYCKQYSNHDIPLSQQGIKQKLKLGAEFVTILQQRGYDGTQPLTILHSPFLRTDDTACAVYNAVKNKWGMASGFKNFALVPEPRLADINKGDFWGRSAHERREKLGPWYDEYRQKKESAEYWFTTKVPGGESPQRVVERAGALCTHLKKNYANVQDLAIVSHDLPERALVMNLLGKNVEWLAKEHAPDNGSIRLLEGPDWEHLEDKGYVFKGFETIVHKQYDTVTITSNTHGQPPRTERLSMSGKSQVRRLEMEEWPKGSEKVEPARHENVHKRPKSLARQLRKPGHENGRS